MEAPRRFVVIVSFLVIASFPFSMIGSDGTATGGQLTVTWVEGSTNELAFSVERSTGTTGTFTEIGTTGPGITTYTDNTVADATTYCYRVRAYAVTAYSDYSNVACGTTAPAFSLTALEMGTGSGTVMSTPSGIICGATCSGTYASGTAVTLSATPATGSTFTGWSGSGCSGTGICTVTLTAATSVTATFALAPLSTTLTVDNAGTGTGTVISTPAGINCGTTCSAGYASGTTVTLTATPAAGSSFSGWSGGRCSGTGTCTVTLTAATTVRATYLSTSSTVTLRVNKLGKGTVTSSPAGIICTPTCSVSYSSGAGVILTATTNSNFKFKGWSGGGCSGTGSCTLTLTGNTTVTATFAKK